MLTQTRIAGRLVRDLLPMLFAALAGSASVAVAAPSIAPSEAMVVREVSGQYSDIKDQLVFSIEEKGLVVSNVLEVGAMLRRTRKDFGIERDVLGDASLIQFCSSAIAHEAVGVDPHVIAYCPYGIAVYTVTDSPGKVYLGYRRLVSPDMPPALQAVLQKAETLLADVVHGAAE